MSVRQATPIDSAGALAARSYGEGRVCTQAGCGTRLNRFNPNDRCYVHERAAVDNAIYYVKPDERAERRAKVMGALPATIAQLAEVVELDTGATRNVVLSLARDGLIYRTGTAGGGPHRVGYIYVRATDGAGGPG